MAGEKSTVGTTTVDAATIDCQKKMDPNIIQQNVTKEEKSSVCEFVASVVKTDHEKLGELEDEKSIDHSGVHLMAKDIEADYLVPENSSVGDSLGPARTPQESMQPVQPGDSLADEQERCGDLSIPLFDLDPETSSTAAVVLAIAPRKLLQNPVARIKGRPRRFASKLDAAIRNMMILWSTSKA